MEDRKKIVYDYREYPVEVYFKLSKRFTLSGVYESEIEDEDKYIRTIMFERGIKEAMDDNYVLHRMFKGTKVYGYSLRKSISFRRKDIQNAS